MVALHTLRARSSPGPFIFPIIFFPSVLMCSNDFSSSLLTLSSAKALYLETVLNCMLEQGKVRNKEDPKAITGHHSAEFDSHTKW